MKFIIKTKVPSNNSLLRMHWAERKRLKAVFMREIWIWVQLVENERIPILREKKKKSVRIILYRKHRRFDKDNAYGGCKMVVDAIRELGLIYNDSPKWLDLTVSQELSKTPETHIMIEDFEEL